MDKELKNIILEFSDKLHEYEATGKDLPQKLETIWSQLTILIEQERTNVKVLTDIL